ncbi:MAG: AAA family ATPase [bacterium]
MRLKSIFISDYKNLKDFSITFNKTKSIDIFTGKNGTGKSNLFEALIEIFEHLYEFDKNGYEISFNYKLVYEIENLIIKIAWKDGKLTIDDKERRTVGETKLPDNLLIYYSGHNNKVTTTVNIYERAFRSRIKNANIAETRRFIGVDKSYKQLLLAFLLIQNNDNKAKKFIESKLNIVSIEPELKIILCRPFYASGNSTYDIKNNDESDRYWKPAGITNEFLDRLTNCIAKESEKVREIGYFAENERYILYFDIKKIQIEFAKDSKQHLFQQFDNLKLIGMLNEISIMVTLKDNTQIPSDHFSDGQFQSVYIYAIIELFKDINCITLLDEPDSFLHPEWQFEFLDQLFEITNSSITKNHVLMSSHNAVTLVPYKEKEIKLFSIENSSVICRDSGKKYAINQLTSDIIQYSVKEQILSILHKINIQDGPVFLTEGSTDPVILNTAWEKLFSTPPPFSSIYAFNCTYLARLLKDEIIYNERKGKAIFGLFDFDEAYNEWNSFLKEGVLLEDDPYKGLCISTNKHNVFVFLLPVPINPTIETQVIKNNTTKETFKHKSQMSIEHLFYADSTTHSYFTHESIPGGGSVLFFNEKKKTYFANNVVTILNASRFEVFRPMFEFIKSKCN